MAGIEGLLHSYARFVALPWASGLAAPQKVWFAIYNPADERRLRARIGEFEVVTKRAGYRWIHVDVTDLFPRWMAAQEYREAYFAAPDDIEMALDDFAESVVASLRTTLEAEEADAQTVVAISGIASLFGLARVSRIIEPLAPIRGRLLLFFPGERDGASYRLLDARDNWNYLAIPITAQET